MRVVELLNARPRVLGLVTVAAASLYVAAHLSSGWIPHDEGQLGQSAERTLAGELPHRDFDEMYTGGLSFLNALAIRLFGVESLSLRVMLWLWFVPTMAAYYYLAGRMLPPVGASLATLLAAAVSVPVYSAPMPSWYNLFFAVIGAAALARFVETERTWWLLAAGFCGGASLLLKITGLYYIAAALLLFAYREQLLSRRGTAPGPASRGWYSWVSSLALVAFGCLGLAFLRSGRSEMNAIHFTLPLAALAGLLHYREREHEYVPSAARLRRMLAMAVPFLIGAAAPLAAFAAYYWLQDGLDDLYRGVFVLPRMRVEGGAFPLPGWEGLAVAALLAALLVSGFWPAGPRRRMIDAVALFVLAALLVGSESAIGFNFAFSALRNILPLLVAAAIWLLVDESRVALSASQRQLLFLAAASAGLGGLIQYPHAYGIYFFYAAPLAVLLAAYLAAAAPYHTPPTILAVGGFYLAFAMLQLNGPDPHRNVVRGVGRRPTEPMRLERCRLTVPGSDAESYRELASLVERNSAPGSAIFAGPDCPEVYFLTKRRNPTGVMYEFFRPGVYDRAEPVLDLLDRERVKVVVVNLRPNFSQPMPSEMVAAIAERFPEYAVVSSPGPRNGPAAERFRVFWRE
jgi:hypothetical protein